MPPPPGLCESGQSQKTWTSSWCAVPQWGKAEWVRVPWPDNLIAVHVAPAMRPHGSDFSNSVEAARSAARRAGPSASSPRPPKVTGRCTSSGREQWQQRLSLTRCWSWRRGSCTKCMRCSCPGTSPHHQPSRRVHPRVVAMRRATPPGPFRVGGPLILRYLGEDLGDARPPGHAGQPEDALVPRLHDRGDVVPLSKDGKDDLLGSGQARGSPQGPYNRRFQPPQVGFRHGRHGHPIERQRGDQRADGPFPPVIG